MTEAEFRRSLRQTLTLLNDLNLLLLPQLIVALEPSLAFRSAVTRTAPTYAQVYRTGLQHRDYNFLLNDFSYLQFYRQGDTREHTNLRFAYYPNPYEHVSFGEFLEKLGEDAGDADVQELYMQLLSEQRETGGAPVVRYESAPAQHVPLKHPASHFHIGLSAEGRWPLDKVLSPLAFALLITKLNYPKNWHEQEDETGGNPFEERLARARADCPELDDLLFTPQEQMQHHFT